MMKKTFSLGLAMALFFAGNFLNAQEIHTQANATNIANESNTVTGWTPHNSSATSMSVETNDVYQGSYAI